MEIKLLSLFVFILLSTNTFAQQASQQDRLAHLMMVKGLLKLNKIPQHKQTRSGSRLIASATYNSVTCCPPVFTRVDTNHYYYKSNYGYDPTADILGMDVITNFGYNIYSNLQQNTQDSLLIWSDSGSALSLDDSVLCSFGTNHKLMSRRDFSLVYGYYSNTYSYDANERLQSEVDTSIYSTTTFVTKTSTSFNTNNKLISVKSEYWSSNNPVWTPSYLDSLFYDVNSNLITIKSFNYNTTSMAWEKSYLTNCTYDAFNKLTQEIRQTWSSNAWVNDFKTTIVNNANHQLTSATYSSYSIGAGNWVFQDKDSFQYASGNYPSAYIYQVWDAPNFNMINDSKYEFTYNSVPQITKSYQYAWRTATNTWADTNVTNFYYENYTPQGIAEATSVAGALTVYPVPSSHSITLEAKWNERQTSVVKIIDLLGNVLQTIQLPESSDIKQVIDISMLPNGLYQVSLQGEKGSLTEKVYKQ